MANMVNKIGIYHSQQDAVEAIRQLEQEGFAPTEIKVITRTSEHAQRIESETDVHTDDVNELIETRENDQGNVPIVPLFAGSGLNAGGTAFNFGAGMPGAGGAVAPAVLGMGGIASGTHDEEGIGDALKALGLKEKLIDSAREAVRQGALLLVVDIEEGSDKEGSGLNRLDKAETVLRSSGAAEIIN